MLTMAALSLASCSTIRPLFQKTEVIADTTTVDTIALTTPIDSLEAEEIPIYEVEEATQVMEELDSLMHTPDTLYIEALRADVETEEESEDFHFEGDQTTSMMIAEYRNMVIEDMVIDLSEGDSCFPADGHVTSGYGWRRSRMHAGIDIKVQTGDNLYAAFDGVVRLAKYYSSYGNCVIIRHYNGLETLYAHASKLLVEVNDHVKAGDVIALGGNTGRSTGSHLHFETRIAGHYFNPTLVIDTKERQIKDAKLYITMRSNRLFVSNNDSEEEREAQILDQISIKYHIVRSGDTLGAIARKHGTSVTSICRLNGIRSTTVLRIGQRLVVRDGVKVAAKTTSSSSSSTTTTTSQPAKAAPAPKQPYSGSTFTYTIKSGDTLGAIAEAYGTRVSTICSINNITARTTLRIGRKLQIPGNGSKAATTTTATKPAATTQSTATPSNGTYHTVVSGDTLSGIATKYNTTIAKLCELNGISRTSILSLKQKIRVK